jgi:peptide/nickel transport system substrate-binding protein
MRRIGLNVELVALDFASITQRRTNKGPVDKGGWSAFLTGWLSTDILDPGVHPMLRGAGEKGYAGWCDDPKIEELRAAWTVAPTPGEQARIAHELQLQACKTLPYIPLGSIPVRSAWRKSVTAVFKAPAVAYYNLGKSA